jgi:hypothetical protein
MVNEPVYVAYKVTGFKMRFLLLYNNKDCLTREKDAC